MNTLHMAQAAYDTASAPIRTNHSIEYETIARATRDLKMSGARSDYPAFVRALHNNRTMWALLAIDVADGGNRLPPELRAQIFYLAEFTANQTRRVLNQDASATALIDINTAVLRGLRQQDTST